MPDRRNRSARHLVAAAATALLLGAASSCTDDTAESDQGVGVDDLEDIETDDLDEAEVALLGSTVTISGEVTDSITEHAFVLGGSDPDAEQYPVFGDDSEGVLIIQSGETAWVIDDRLQITGTVVRYETTMTEAAMGIDLDDDLLASLEGRIAIEASTVDPLPDDE